MADNYISRQEEKGTVNISEDVVINIVRSSVSEIEGFASFSSAAGAEIAEMIGIKAFNKGVKVQFAEGKIIIDTIITVNYGSNIVDVAKNIQSHVLSSVQSMLGFEDVQVNVHVSGIEF